VMWSRVMANDPSFGVNPLWVACWRCARPTLPQGWSAWRYWQDGKADIPGVTKALDDDMFHGTDTRLRGSVMAAPAINGGAAYTIDPQVRVQLLGMDGVSFRSSLDGSIWSDWQPYRTATPVTLPSGDGAKSVYIQLEDASSNLSPVSSDSVILDSTPPQLDLGAATLTLGRLHRGTAAVPATVTWGAQDATSGVALVELDQTCAGGSSQVLAQLDPTAGSAAQKVRLTPGTACQLTLQGSDAAGLTSALTALEPTVTSTDDTASSMLTYSGAWSSRTRSGYSGGTVHFAAKHGASATFSFSGTDLAVVSSYGPDRGRAAVLVDGVRVAVVDLYRATRGYRQVVFQMHLPAGGEHVAVVQLLRKRNAASSGSRVDLDALITMDGGTVAAPPTTRPAHPRQRGTRVKPTS